MVEPIICVESTEVSMFRSVVFYISNGEIQSIEELVDDVIGKAMVVKRV